MNILRTPSFFFSVFSSSLLMGLVFLTSSCGESSVCYIRHNINAPQNRNMRRELMASALTGYCNQMLARHAPLKLADDRPIIGRFYPRFCSQQSTANGDLFVEFSGEGYVYTNLTKKITFDLTGAVHYEQDFKVTESGACLVYAYFKPQKVESSNFKVVAIENQVSPFFGASQLAQNFGAQTLTEKLQQGFTVIHSPGSTYGDSFGFGQLELGKKTNVSSVPNGEHGETLESGRTEINQEQRDFIGPITIKESGLALHVWLDVQGNQAIDALLFNRREAESALGDYLHFPGARSIPAPPLWADVIQPSFHHSKDNSGPKPGAVSSGSTSKKYHHVIPVQPGSYYVVLDNTSSLGQVSPQVVPFHNHVVALDYVIQLGDKP